MLSSAKPDFTTRRYVGAHSGHGGIGEVLLGFADDYRSTRRDGSYHLGSTGPCGDASTMRSLVWVLPTMPLFQEQGTLAVLGTLFFGVSTELQS